MFVNHELFWKCLKLIFDMGVFGRINTYVWWSILFASHRCSCSLGQVKKKTLGENNEYLKLSVF